MARAGISTKVLSRFGCQLECHINDDEIVKSSDQQMITRASLSVDLVSDRINGGIYVIGNAPTALVRLLDLVEQRRVKPALIVGIPVGFVNAKESKERLMSQIHIPYITVKGTKGGSALSAGVINELAKMALEDFNNQEVK
jgi:precorrin-8X/cobalt-precorrin-8 methylmutase